MNLTGDLRYVAAGEFAAFAEEEADNVRQAAFTQYHATNGTYPEGLEHLVSAGLLPRDTWQTVGRLGWQYARLEAGRAYRINL